MHITCEGKAYELFEGATPQNLWNMVSGGRIPAAQAAFSVHDHSFSLLYHSVQFLFSMVYIPCLTI